MGKGIRNHEGVEAAGPLVLPLVIPGGQDQTGQIGSRDPPPRKVQGRRGRTRSGWGEGRRPGPTLEIMMMMTIAWLQPGWYTLVVEH